MVLSCFIPAGFEANHAWSSESVGRIIIPHWELLLVLASRLQESSVLHQTYLPRYRSTLKSIDFASAQSMVTFLTSGRGTEIMDIQRGSCWRGAEERDKPSFNPACVLRRHNLRTFNAPACHESLMPSGCPEHKFDIRWAIASYITSWSLGFDEGFTDMHVITYP
jgi:hypothetical protein